MHNGRIVPGDLTWAERRAVLDTSHRHSPGVSRQLMRGVDKGFDAAGPAADRPSARAEDVNRLR